MPSLLLKESLFHLTLCLIDFPEHFKFFNHHDVKHQNNFSAQRSVSLLFRSDQKQHLKTKKLAVTHRVLLCTPINVSFIVYYQIPVEYTESKLKSKIKF